MTTPDDSERQRLTLLALTQSSAIDAGARTAAFREICHLVL